MDEARWGFEWESMTEKCIEALVLAQHEAEFLQAPHVGTEHVLIGLLSGGNLGAAILLETGVDAAIVRATMEKFRSRERVPQVRRFSWRVRRAVEIAFEEASEQGERFVNTDHLYLGLLAQDDCTAMKILGDLQANVRSVLERLHHRRKRSGTRAEGLLYPQDLLEQMRVAGPSEVPEMERVGEADGEVPAEAPTEAPLPPNPGATAATSPPAEPSLRLDDFLAVLDELGKALQSAQEMVESVRPPEPPPSLPPIVIPEVDLNWPVVDEEVYPIGRLVRQILVGAILRHAVRVRFEPREEALCVEYHGPSGHVEVLEVPAVLRSVLPFRVMRMARLNPMEKGRELEGRMVFRYRRRGHRMRVRSEPVRKGLLVEVYLEPLSS